MQPNREFTDLGLPQKYHRRLERMGITSVTDLCARTEKELRFYRSIGDKTIRAVKDALAAKGLCLADNSRGPRPNCVCSGWPAMELWMADDIGEIWECPNCARLLYRSRVSDIQTWYVAEASIPELEVNKRLCPTCQRETVHIKKVDGGWLCLECRVLESDKKRG
jgi:hypothetical protein